MAATGASRPYEPFRASPKRQAIPQGLPYTGQRSEGDALGGLMDYGARHYDPSLGRFISADTIVPNPGNPGDLNRFAYVRNNPLRYTDPSGHIAENESEQADDILAQLQHYGVTIERDWGLGYGGQSWESGTWTLYELERVWQAIQDFGAEIGRTLQNGASDSENFRAVVGPLTIVRRRERGVHKIGGTLYRINALHYNGTITLFDDTFFDFDKNGNRILRDPTQAQGTIVHEAAHGWDHHRPGYALGGDSMRYAPSQ